MIRIQKSETADTRTCDYSKVSKDTLLASSKQHINDVGQALTFFASKLGEADSRHDTDKLTDIDGFHADFLTGFKQTGWWDRHRVLNRHHLQQEDGIPPDVNLIDVLDFIADCVMAGMARSGSVYPLKLSPELLERAFQGTVELLKAQVTVEEPVTANAQQGRLRMQTHTHDSYTTSPVRLRVLTLADFGETLLAIKQGLRMQRSSWSDKTAYIALAVPDDRAPYVYLKTAHGTFISWMPLQSDLLASDWRTL